MRILILILGLFYFEYDKIVRLRDAVRDSFFCEGRHQLDLDYLGFCAGRQWGEKRNLSERGFLPIMCDIKLGFSSRSMQRNVALERRLLQNGKVFTMFSETGKPEIRSPFLKVLFERDYIEDVTNLGDLDNLLFQSAANKTENPLSAYVGFDLTGGSLHVGHLVLLMIMRIFQKCGYRPIFVLGRGTTLIGSYGGSDAMLRSNMKSFTDIIKRCIKFDVNLSTGGVILDNYDWLHKMNLLDYLNNYGRLVPAKFLRSRCDFIDQRSRNIKSESSTIHNMAQANYPILQAIDFVHLAKVESVKIQFGGADQWSNILCGISLADRLGIGKLYGVTTPLIKCRGKNTSKMSKSGKNAVYLSSESCSPFDFWQYWRNTPDDYLIKYLKLFTDTDLDEIDGKCQLSVRELNSMKERLADDVTLLVHGPMILTSIHETVDLLYNHKIRGQNPSIPTIVFNRSDISEGIPLTDALVKFDFATSKSDARRQIIQGGVRVNNMQIVDPFFKLDDRIILDSSKEYVIISKGKKNFGIIRFAFDVES